MLIFSQQELKAEADSSSKDLQDREKKAISDEEKQKSAVSKLSKLKKTLKEVFHSSCL